MAGAEHGMPVGEWERVEDAQGQRAELWQGQVRMNPAPRPVHQHVVRLLANALEAACGPDQRAEFDTEWRIFATASSTLYHARRPDVLVARASALRRVAALVEAPLVVIEVLSPGNRKPDIDEKRTLYLNSGCRYYAEVSISEDETDVAITWYRADPSGWLEVARARGDGPLEVSEPFPVVIQPNGLLN